MFVETLIIKYVSLLQRCSYREVSHQNIVTNILI